MNELRNFYNNPSSKRVTRLRGPRTCGIHLNDDESTDNLERKEELCKTKFLTGTDYVHAIVEREEAAAVINYQQLNNPELNQDIMIRGLDSMETLSHLGSIQTLTSSKMNLDKIETAKNEIATKVYDAYAFSKKEQLDQLPIYEHKEQILKSIKSWSVLMIEGPTGCGKTTQVAQWILDDHFQRREYCKIVVTQPRRIAAISIASRVAQERGWDVGGVVGYQVGLDNKTSKDTLISFVTTGVLLQKLVQTKNLNEYTHIILDEVHERGQEMDFLLLVVKKLLYTTASKAKILLMSATFDTHVFTNYFKTLTVNGLDSCGVVKMQNLKRMHNVKEFYLDSLSKFGEIYDRALPKNSEPAISADMYKLVVKLVHVFEQIDKQEALIVDDDNSDIPSVLIFLPGINEIEELYGHLTDQKLREELMIQGDEFKLWVLPLHSTITADEQVRVFKRAPPGHRKVILSTNIAESSITVPDIKYVIDFCLMKTLVVDPLTNFTSLELGWASKNNCIQRGGRAGRVREGRVYRLVTDAFYRNMPQECPPELVRAPLERLVLLAKTLDMGPPTEILALALTPPDLSNIHRTSLVLKEMGAMLTTLDDKPSFTDGDLTYLGQVMTYLPVDVRVSKLIFLGYIFGIMEDCIIIAAAMTVRNPFSNPFRERLNAYNSKLAWADGSCSDLLALHNVYIVWAHLKRTQHFQTSNTNELQWARRFYVQLRALREIEDMVRELKQRLSKEHIVPVNNGQSPWTNSEKALALKLVIAGAFYPNYFLQEATDENREREAIRTLAGLDPRHTVFLRDFPMHQPGPLYAANIARTVHQILGETPTVTFDTNSQKVFLTFDEVSKQKKGGKQSGGQPHIPGNVVLPVYKAVKIRQLRTDIRLALLPQEKAAGLFAALESMKKAVDKDAFVPRLPEIDDTTIPLIISQYVDAGKFWAHYNDESTHSDLKQIERELNSKNKLLVMTEAVQPGDLVAAPYNDGNDTGYYRARVYAVDHNMVTLFYIDYGSHARLSTQSVYELPQGICRVLPPLAMQCSMAQIAPAMLLDKHHDWSKEANQLFCKLTANQQLLAKVYSVVRGVVSVEVFVGDLNINQELVRQGLARPAEEPYDSKKNHDIRETATELNMAQKRAYNKQQVELAFQELRVMEGPSARECVTNVLLKGPFSPIESSVHALMSASLNKTVNIDWSSVNSVLLDTEPQEMYARLLVAGMVGTNESSGNLNLRHTTLMPNIPGLPTLIALLFCPKAEFRCDSRRMRYVSALCGLGTTPDGTPLFPEHNILVDVDIDLDDADVAAINHVRHLMDTMMRPMSLLAGAVAPAGDRGQPASYTTQVPALIRDDIIRLLNRRRVRHESFAVPRAWEWDSCTAEVKRMEDERLASFTTIFPLHHPLMLDELTAEERHQLLQEATDLEEMVFRSSASTSNKEVACGLCATENMNIQCMRIHLHSRSHHDKLDGLFKILGLNE